MSKRILYYLLGNKIETYSSRNPIKALGIPWFKDYEFTDEEWEYLNKLYNTDDGQKLAEICDELEELREESFKLKEKYDKAFKKRKELLEHLSSNHCCDWKNKVDRMVYFTCETRNLKKKYQTVLRFLCDHDWLIYKEELFKLLIHWEDKVEFIYSAIRFKDETKLAKLTEFDKKFFFYKFLEDQKDMRFKGFKENFPEACWYYSEENYELLCKWFRHPDRIRQDREYRAQKFSERYRNKIVTPSSVYSVPYDEESADMYALITGDGDKIGF